MPAAAEDCRERTASNHSAVPHTQAQLAAQIASKRKLEDLFCDEENLQDDPELQLLVGDGAPDIVHGATREQLFDEQYFFIPIPTNDSIDADTIKDVNKGVGYLQAEKNSLLEDFVTPSLSDLFLWEE